MAKKKSDSVRIKEIAKRTQELSSLITKLHTSMTTETEETPCDSDDTLSPEEINEQHRQNLAWLVGQRVLIEQNQGNYIGVYDQTIVATAPSEHLVRTSAARKKSVSPDEILVVPLNIAGSEELWSELQAMMDQ